jgi:hypothetical protein
MYFLLEMYLHWLEVSTAQNSRQRDQQSQRFPIGLALSQNVTAGSNSLTLKKLEIVFLNQGLWTRE